MSTATASATSSSARGYDGWKGRASGLPRLDLRTRAGVRLECSGGPEHRRPRVVAGHRRRRQRRRLRRRHRRRTPLRRQCRRRAAEPSSTTARRLALPQRRAWTVNGAAAECQLGYSVATAGDVNGDGYSDVIVGIPYQTNGQAGEGVAVGLPGSGAGLSTTPSWFAESNQAGAHFGLSVGTAGDVNGDGFADVIVGAPDFDGGQTNEGRAFVYPRRRLVAFLEPRLDRRDQPGDGQARIHGRHCRRRQRRRFQRRHRRSARLDRRHQQRGPGRGVARLAGRSRQRHELDLRLRPRRRPPRRGRGHRRRRQR